VNDPAVGDRVRYRGSTVTRIDSGTEGVLATLSDGVEGTVVEHLPGYSDPCVDCEGDDCGVCDGSGTIPPDPVWVVEWECPEGWSVGSSVRTGADGSSQDEVGSAADEALP
jgi:hypothetical protein